MRILLPAIALMLGSATAIAQPRETAVSSTPDIRPFIAQEINPKVHLLTLPKDWYAALSGNVVLIEQSDGFVVVDSGGNAGNGRAVVRYAKSLADRPIKAVMITHWHGDHPQGLSAIRDAYPKVRIISTRGTEEGIRGPASYDIGYTPDPKFDRATANLAEKNKADYLKLLDDPTTPPDRKERIKRALGQFDEMTRDFVGSYLVLPTETFEHELVIKDRDVPVHMLFLGRANTDGDAIAWLPRQKIVASGDIVVSPYPFGFGSYPADWIVTLGKLKALGFKTLIPGHGDPMTGVGYLDRLIASIRDLQAQVGPLAKAGVSLDNARKRVDFSKSIATFGDTAVIKANLQGLFFDPMIGSAYKEARGEPILQGDLEGFPPPEVTDTPPLSRAIHHKF
ncbi:MBL fold metallo-hydrolase [Sphingomonas sp. URHD0057]|uniref:MBL fold metallo-hydrolase n=1 Tax=Sphingomonas sp. URHD0057 TaxID=1380389 RepID=UPI0009DF83B2|nr:MBL fold metallo-hydrolase [Sphingomonas sp. URHD0057]